VGTTARSINAAGPVTGYYFDASDVDHGFVRSADGTIATFDAPRAGTGFGQGTLAVSISDAGAITGSYANASRVYHGFLLAP